MLSVDFPRTSNRQHKYQKKLRCTSLNAYDLGSVTATDVLTTKNCNIKCHCSEKNNRKLRLLTRPRNWPFSHLPVSQNRASHTHLCRNHDTQTMKNACCTIRSPSNSTCPSKRDTHATITCGAFTRTNVPKINLLTPATR